MFSIWWITTQKPKTTSDHTRPFFFLTAKNRFALFQSLINVSAANGPRSNCLWSLHPANIIVPCEGLVYMLSVSSLILILLHTNEKQWRCPWTRQTLRFCFMFIFLFILLFITTSKPQTVCSNNQGLTTVIGWDHNSSTFSFTYWSKKAFKTLLICSCCRSLCWFVH